jgi:hypothetical protein
MIIDQKVLMEGFIKTVPNTPVTRERVASLRELLADGLVEFFVGGDDQVRALLTAKGFVEADLAAKGRRTS